MLNIFLNSLSLRKMNSKEELLAEINKPPIERDERKILFTLEWLLGNPEELKEVIGLNYALDLLLANLSETNIVFKRNLEELLDVRSMTEQIVKVKGEYDLICKRENMLNDLSN